MKQKSFLILSVFLIWGFFLGRQFNFLVSAQSAAVTWEAPSISNSGSCNPATALNLAQATAEQKGKFSASKCVPLSSILQSSSTVCENTTSPSFIGQSVFSQLPALNFATVSATQADTFKYPVDLCGAGSICTFCTVTKTATAAVSPTPVPTMSSPTPTPLPAGNITPQPASQSGSTALPTTGSGEVLLFSLMGLTVVGSGIWFWRRRAA